MRILLILTLSMAGCGRTTETETSPLDKKLRPAGESRLWITGPPGDGKPFSPGETFECTGQFTIGEGHRPLSIPKIILLSGQLSRDQVRAVQGEQRPEGKVPFEAKLKCPKEPGEYALRATMVVTPDPKVNGGKPFKEIVLTSPLVRFQVKDNNG